ncbi:hypothetical protein [Streptomyces cinerochromogenes]|uniref:hypothetical protein n=1 Tax=Streptomyces cinerochromogenes TaxID=66422 RepID=UPI0033AAD62D
MVSEVGDGDGTGGFEPRRDCNAGWRKPDSLQLLCRIAREAGFLKGVDVVPIATDPTRREFLLTVSVTEDLVLASPRFLWNEVEPPLGMEGIEAARHVLGRIQDIARRTEVGLHAYGWLQVASELERVRAILERAQGS